MDQEPVGQSDARWCGLYRAGGVAALLIVALIPIQMAVFVAYPPPNSVAGFYALFQRNPLLGLLSMDLLYLLSNALLSVFYISLFPALRRAGESLMAIALTLGLLGIAAYPISNTAFEMLSLSSQHAAATTDAQRAMLMAAGQAMLAIYKGTAFNVYYVLNAAALLILAILMRRSPLFGKAEARLGLAAGVLMIIPSTAGTIGLVFAIASLLPWGVFSVLVARRLFRLSRGIDGGRLT